MVNIEYANAYSETLEILKYISKEEYNKIPKELIEVYEKNANKNYKFTYNPDKTLQEQNVSKTAKYIIAILFRDYWATDIQRKEIILKQNNTRRILEEEKMKKYNPADIFKHKENENQLVIINEKKWYKKLIKMLKKIFIK